MSPSEELPGLVKLGDPALRRVCRAVPAALHELPEAASVAEELAAAVRHLGGAAIAAPQLGADFRLVVYNRRAFEAAEWAALGGDDDSPTLTHTNPACAAVGDAVVLDFEGCLSVPRIAGVVARAATVDYTATSASGAAVTVRLTGRAARIVQHEAHHLDGILFVDVADTRGLMTTGSVSRIYGGDPTRAVERLGIGGAR